MARMRYAEDTSRLLASTCSHMSGLFIMLQMSQPMESDEERVVRLSAYRVRDLRVPADGVTVFDNCEEEGEDQQSDMDHERARALEGTILQHAYLHRDPGWNVSREDFDEVNRDNAFEVAQTEVLSWRQVKEHDQVLKRSLPTPCTLFTKPSALGFVDRRSE